MWNLPGPTFIWFLTTTPPLFPLVSHILLQVPPLQLCKSSLQSTGC